MTGTILVATAGSGPLGGADEVLFQLIDGLGNAQYRWIVVTSHQTLADACRDRGIPVSFPRSRSL